MIEEKVVREALQTILHPKLKKSLIEIGMIPDFSIKGDAVTVTLALKSDTSPMKNVFMAAIEKVVGAVPGGASVQVKIILLGM